MSKEKARNVRGFMKGHTNELLISGILLGGTTVLGLKGKGVKNKVQKDMIEDIALRSLFREKDIYEENIKRLRDSIANLDATKVINRAINIPEREAKLRIEENKLNQILEECRKIESYFKS